MIDLPILCSLLFALAFVFRYLRLIVHIWAYLNFKDVPEDDPPLFTSFDCAIVIPTVNPLNVDFHRTLVKAFANKPREVLIVTVGGRNVQRALEACQALPYANFRVLEVPKPNKRAQVICGVNATTAPIVATLDDHIFLPSTFINLILRPFSNPKVGGVGTRRMAVRVQHPKSWWADFTNFLYVTYLERRNFENLGTTYVDGGISCLSGGAAAYRTRILRDPQLQREFLNETAFNPTTGEYEICGVGDDKWLTRWLFQHDWEIKIQFAKEGLVYVTGGDPAKFFGQCLRWTRTRAKENPKLIRDPVIRRKHPWTLYANYISGIINYALFWDPVLLALLYGSV
jgi:cellulose synthase/poly-beta-1,6-N-acetylglucosamine synthase-like glycosyltransferase